MEPNYSYMLKKSEELAGSGKVLDYGCGGGEVVEVGLTKGLDLAGVDGFYGGNRAQDIAASRDLLHIHVFPLQENFSVPFPDDTFDLVISNQVMEHVEDLDFTLREISRVLKPSGYLLTLFPTYEVIREGHCGIPFAHRFGSNKKWQYPYMRVMRALGLGYFKEGKSQKKWVMDFMEWLDEYTVYRTDNTIAESFSRNGFLTDHIEADYMEFRLKNKGIHLPAYVTSSSGWRKFASKLCRSLAGAVILAAKKPSQK